MMRWGFSEHDEVGFSYSSVVLIVFYQCGIDSVVTLPHSV